jgi:hypothetical protein
VPAFSSPAALPLALVAGTMVLTVAACGGAAGSSPTPSSAASTTSAAASSASSVPSTPAATPRASTTTTSAAGTGCAVGDLRIRYADDKGGAGAGSVTGTLTFTNTGSAACTLAGFPGVSYVGGGNGTQVGAAADRTASPTPKTVLEPGDKVRSAIVETSTGPYSKSQCRPTAVDGFRVYVPDETRSIFVAHPTTGCANATIHLLAHKAYR